MWHQHCLAARRKGRGMHSLSPPKNGALEKHDGEKGESHRKLMAEYGVGSSTLYDLKKQDKRLSFVASTEGLTGKNQKRKTLKGLQMQYVQYSIRIILRYGTARLGLLLLSSTSHGRFIKMHWFFFRLRYKFFSQRHQCS